MFYNMIDRMKNHNIFSLAVFLYIASALCLSSCISRNSENTSNDEELGDTVPASEFSVVEDTASATVNDTIVKK